MHLGLKIDLCHLIFIRVSECFQLPVGEVTAENLVREELGLLDTRDSAGNECRKKGLWLCAVSLGTGMCMSDESLAIDLQ